MSIDRWNREDSAPLRRIEEKQDALLEAHPFGCADGQVSLDRALAEKIDKAIGQWVDREKRPGGLLHGLGPDATKQMKP
ncbi:hypothetical protein [Stenotrophomonas forensis]|uniref:hypothetical protein n=1 Tax=Stenotrophomonas forensis TaxID=2871169 RepID=UPI0039C71BD5